MSAVSITITNAASELERVSALADDFAAANRLSSDVVADLHVALDEVLTNIIKYGYTDDRVHEINIQLSIEDGVLVAKFEDDGRPFDPLIVPEPDVSAAAAGAPCRRARHPFLAQPDDRGELPPRGGPQPATIQAKSVPAIGE